MMVMLGAVEEQAKTELMKHMTKEGGSRGDHRCPFSNVAEGNVRAQIL
jgi:hypothetical protein